MVRRILSLIAVAALSGCDSSATAPRLPALSAAVHHRLVDGDLSYVEPREPPALTLPKGFSASKAFTFADAPANLLAVDPHGAIYWLSDELHTGRRYPDGTHTSWSNQPMHRIERLDPKTGAVTALVKHSPATLYGLSTWAHGVVATRRSPTTCGKSRNCTQDSLVVFNTDHVPATTQAVASSDPAPDDNSTVFSLPWRDGLVIVSSSRTGHYMLRTWNSRSNSLITVRSDLARVVGLAVVADVAVWQTYGQAGLKAAALEGAPKPVLPPSAVTDGVNPSSVNDQLVWVEQPGNGLSRTSRLYASHYRNHAFDEPRVIDPPNENVAVLQPVGDHWLFVRAKDSEGAGGGLYAFDMRLPKPPKLRLLTSAQEDLIFNPARFGSGGGIFVYASSPRFLDGPESLILLQPPR